MSDNKNDKDSYAQDTLAFSVPDESAKRKNAYPQNAYPQSNRPQRQKYPEQYPQEQYQYEQYPEGQYQQEYYPQKGQPIYDQYRPQGQRAPGQRLQGQNAQGQRAPGQRPQGQNAQGSRPQGQRPQGQNAQGSRPQSQRPQGQKPQRQRPKGQRPQGQKPQRQRPQSQRPQGQNKRNNTQKNKRDSYNNSGNKQIIKKVKKKRGCLTKILLSLLGLLLLVFIIYSVIAMLVISKIDTNERGDRVSPSHSLFDSSNVKNILLIGNDSRGEDRGRSDSMILLSINSSTNKINIISLMRDTYVEVPGYGGCKLNAAYSYGGPELLMDTIEENFYIEVDDYISVNFTSFAGIVDSIGGVEIEVNEDEAAAINVLLDSKEGISLFGTPDESDYLNGAGKYKLNGKQALCYARLRKVGNADFERTERQRKVLSGLLGNIGFSSVFSIIGDAFPDVSTNMSKLQMYGLSLRLPFVLGFYDVEQLRIPVEDTFWSSEIDGQDVLEIDMDANLDIIEKDVYGN